MKALLLFLAVMTIAIASSAQLKSSQQNPCAVIFVDILDGKVNGTKPDFTQAEIKRIIPCFTSEEPENNTSKCGGMVSYKNNDVYFYTGRDYIEIREKFKGKLSLPLMGASRTSMFKWFGNPKMKDTNWDAFQTSYGIIILYYTKAAKVNKIQFSTHGTENIELCQ